MIRKLIVYINSDRSVLPKELKIANQFEIKTNEIKFIFDGDIPRTGYPYLILTNRNGSFYLPLVDDSVVFGSQETWIMGGWSAHIMISQAEIINGIVNKSEKLFISDDFGLWVEPSDINIDDLKEQQLPTPLKLLYDDLFALKERVEEILDGGLSDGKDGMSAYELALQEGFVGTLDDWLNSLKGDKGDTGPTGPAYTLTASDKAAITASVKSEIDPELDELKESKANLSHTHTMSQITDLKVPSKTSELTNDSGFLTEHQDLSSYAKKSELPTKTSQLTNDSGFLTEHQSLTDYAKKSELPTKTSQLTNDSGFLTQHQSLSGYAKTADHYTKTESDNKYQSKGNYLTSIPSEYVTESELTAKKYLTSYTETDPTVPSWAKASSKPSYTYSEVGAEKSGAVSSHNSSTSAHSDIRTKISSLEESKVDLNQGSENVGKMLVVGTDGKITLMDIPEGSSGDVTGVFDENNNILLSGDIAIGTYTLAYVNTDGTISGAGSLVVSEIVPEPTYKNLADPTSSDWQEGYRLSITSGGTSALAGHTTTNYIPCKLGDVLRVKGMDIVNENAASGSTSQKFVVYNSNKGNLGGLYGVTSGTLTEGYGKMVTIDGDISTYTIMINNAGGQSSSTEIAYIRLDGLLMNGYTKNDVVITINQEIV